MKDLCQKRNVKLIFFEAPTGCQEPGLLNVWKSLTWGVMVWHSLMARTDWPWLSYFTTDLRRQSVRGGAVGWQSAVWIRSCPSRPCGRYYTPTDWSDRAARRAGSTCRARRRECCSVDSGTVALDSRSRTRRRREKGIQRQTESVGLPGPWWTWRAGRVWWAVAGL